MSDKINDRGHLQCQGYTEMVVKTNAIENSLDNFDNKLDKIDEKVDLITTHLAVYNEQLKLHIAGVEEARKENKLLREFIDKHILQNNKRLMPIEEHILKEKYSKQFTRTLIKVITAVGSVIAFIIGLISQLKH